MGFQHHQDTFIDLLSLLLMNSRSIMAEISISTGLTLSACESHNPKSINNGRWLIEVSISFFKFKKKNIANTVGKIKFSFNPILYFIFND